MKEQSSFLVRIKNKMKTFIRGEEDMITTTIESQDNKNSLSFWEAFIMKIGSLVSKGEKQYKGNLQSGNKVDFGNNSDPEDYYYSKKRRNFLNMYKVSMYKVRPKDILKNESPKGYKVRRDRKYNGLKGSLSKEEAMKLANETTIYYNKDPKAIELVQLIKDQGVEDKREQRRNEER